MMMDRKEAFVRAARFEHPDYIPSTYCINESCWHHYPKEALWDLMEAHPLLFPSFQRPHKDWKPNYQRCARRDTPYTDPMGCTWVTSDDGIVGTVKGHPLEDWSAFGTTWHIPDPNVCDGLNYVNWDREEENWARIRESGGSFIASLRHGHTFLQLCDLRGYENFLFDMMDEEPMIWRLIEELEAFNLAIVKRFIKNGCAYMQYPDDLGMQVGPMLPPALFRRYILPSYKRLMQPAQDAGVPIQMHSDGDIRLLADDLVQSGVEVINLQDLVNGVDWIASRFRGRICVELDIDRQKITPCGTPEQIDALIRSEVEALATPAGGLCLTYGLYPGVPLENAAAVMDAMEKYAFHHF